MSDYYMDPCTRCGTFCEDDGGCKARLDLNPEWLAKACVVVREKKLVTTEYVAAAAIREYLRCSASPPAADTGVREEQGGFCIGDEVEYVGKYKDDEGWKGETFIICEIRKTRYRLEFTIREKVNNCHDDFTGLTSDLCESDLRIVRKFNQTEPTPKGREAE